MPNESSPYRPNESTAERAWQENVVERFKEFGVTQDAEFFIVPVKKPDGVIETHYVPKHSGSLEGEPHKMVLMRKGAESGKKTIEWVFREEVIEAIAKIYPELYEKGEKPTIDGALSLLKARKSRAKK